MRSDEIIDARPAGGCGKLMIVYFGYTFARRAQQI